uniref:C3H1-type domain-containing protein n=1 Tax=Fagus sylvatica TaxID=28930 RepID=A0A2N9HXF5_FAGSY
MGDGWVQCHGFVVAGVGCGCGCRCEIGENFVFDSTWIPAWGVGWVVDRRNWGVGLAKVGWDNMGYQWLLVGICKHGPFRNGRTGKEFECSYTVKVKDPIQITILMARIKTQLTAFLKKPRPSSLSFQSKDNKKSKARIVENKDMGSEGDSQEVEVVVPELDEKDMKSFEKVQKIIEAGQLEKLKVDQCKVYLRKNGLRLTGNKDTLIQRIKEHLEILNGGGEMKYPASSFVLNCKGDACTGDVVMFEQNVYEMFNIASRSASGPPCGKRIVAGRIVKESYGAAKQQHTFTFSGYSNQIEVLWSKGEKPLHPLLIKGRNLYRLKTLRQRWEDEGKRQKVLMDKHSRGSLARSDREARVQEKENRKMVKANRISKKEEPKRNQPQFNSISTAKSTIQPPQSGLLVNSRQPTFQPSQSGPSINSRKPTISQQQFGAPLDPGAMRPQQLGSFTHLGKPTEQAQQAGLSSEPRKVATQPQQQTNTTKSDYHHQPSQNFVECKRARLSESTYHRQPLTSMNHFPPLTSMNHFPPSSPPQRQGHRQQQLCKYYAQGRCYFGDSCKFLHELRRESGQRR